jgi:hypothetical protein
VTSDCYAILGVTPTAEDVVIGAAYRALMRHYHPDTNPDPSAQARAQEIVAAYSVLRDPERRAEYDAQRAEGGGWWPIPDAAEEAPPPMRRVGIATTLVAAALVGAVWLWPPIDEPVGNSNAVTPARQSAATDDLPPVKPPEQLQSEGERLAALAAPAVMPATRVVDDSIAAEIPEAAVEPPPPAMTRTKPAPAPRRPLLAVPQAAKAAPPRPRPAQSDRVATLDRMSAGFFSQSMANATDGKKQLLLAARDRSEAQRKACKSDSCVADALVRQIRETGLIMEQPTDAKN